MLHPRDLLERLVALAAEEDDVAGAREARRVPDRRAPLELDPGAPWRRGSAATARSTSAPSSAAAVTAAARLSALCSPSSGVCTRCGPIRTTMPRSSTRSSDQGRRALAPEPKKATLAGVVATMK